MKYIILREFRVIFSCTLHANCQENLPTPQNCFELCRSIDWEIFNFNSFHMRFIYSQNTLQQGNLFVFGK